MVTVFVCVPLFKDDLCNQTFNNFNRTLKEIRTLVFRGRSNHYELMYLVFNRGKKNPSCGRHWISQCVRIVTPIPKQIQKIPPSAPWQKIITSCVMFHVSCFMCQVSYVMCHMSSVICHLSSVTCHLSPTPTARAKEHPLVKWTPTMHSRLVHQDNTNKNLHIWKPNFCFKTCQGLLVNFAH